MDRRQFHQTESLEELLAEEAKRLRAEAKLLPPGTQTRSAHPQSSAKPKPARASASGFHRRGLDHPTNGAGLFKLNL